MYSPCTPLCFASSALDFVVSVPFFFFFFFFYEFSVLFLTGGLWFVQLDKGLLRGFDNAGVIVAEMFLVICFFSVCYVGD